MIGWPRTRGCFDDDDTVRKDGEELAAGLPVLKRQLSVRLEVYDDGALKNEALT